MFWGACRVVGPSALAETLRAFGGLGFRAHGLFKVKGLGLGFKVQGSGFEV